MKNIHISRNKAFGALKKKINSSLDVDIKDIKVEEPVR